MERLNRNSGQYKKHPERILQIGEGNFLRCFIGWQVDILNEKKGLDAGIVVARPIDTEFPPTLNTQDGLYTTLLRGYDENNELKDEKRVVSAVTREISIYKEYKDFLAVARQPEIRFVVSNTTEAGIVFSDKDKFNDAPASAFPAKLTRFMYERFEYFDGADSKGLILIPCELIDYNGEELKKIVLQYAELWNLSSEFKKWVDRANTFCSTLVDRIVTGYPQKEAESIEDELGYRDQFMVTGEYFHLFVIQAPEFVAEELRIADSGLNIEITEDLKPYKERKVGILNGSHTAIVPIAHLCGIALVKEAVSDKQIERYLSRLLDDEIIPSLGMPADYLKEFADSVIGRFRNPFIDHKLLDISLNSMTKFKTRLLPQFINYYKNNNTVPKLMSLSLAALICFYKGENRGKSWTLRDDQHFLEMYGELWSDVGETITEEQSRHIAETVLRLDSHWGTSMLDMDGLLEKVTSDIVSIVNKGMESVLQEYL